MRADSAPVYDRRSPYADERDPDCLACQDGERHDDHTCENKGIGPLEALLAPDWPRPRDDDEPPARRPARGARGAPTEEET